MAKLHAYLNFDGNCEQAFQFYQEVFGKELLGVHRFGDMPSEGENSIPEHYKDYIMHTALMINDQVMLMGSDVIEGYGQKLTYGTGTYLMLDVDTREEASLLYERLTHQGVVEMPLGQQYFAELFASFQDQFGIAWMIHFEGQNDMNP